MTTLRDWKAEVRALLGGARFSYPVPADANFVRDAAVEPVVGAGIPPDLAEFYGEIGEVSLPDIGNGFFIHSAATLPAAAETGLPVAVTTPAVGVVATFGSDGGGGLFCMAVRDGAIYHLPSGEVLAGVYDGEPRMVATDLDGFLERLLRAVRAFVASGDIETV